MKKQNFIITSLFLFWIIGTTAAQTITGKVINIHAQAIDGATVILQTIDSTFVDAVITDTMTSISRRTTGRLFCCWTMPEKMDFPERAALRFQ